MNRAWSEAELHRAEEEVGLLPERSAEEVAWVIHGRPVCACPCKRPLVGRPGRVKYIDHRHRQRAYEQRRAVELRSAGFPTLLSKHLAQTSNPTQNRQADAPRQTMRVKRRSSGAQISYRKAVLALALDYQREGHGWTSAKAKAERVLQQALPDRQRAQLHAREQRRAA